jgi:lipoyl-dependent peroxiredoxin
MALSAALAEAGHPPAKIHTAAKVHLSPVPGGFAISRIDLVTEVKRMNVIKKAPTNR